MISAYFSGRLGNQFFEYAYCRRLLECREGYKDSFLFNHRLVVSSGPEEDGFEDSLKYFNVKEYTTTEKKPSFIVGRLEAEVFVLSISSNKSCC